MKVKFLAMVMVLMLTGCGSGNKKEESNTSNKLTVYTSFYAMYDFTKMIVGDTVDLKMLMPSGVEPHDYEPSAKDMAELQNADVFVYSGKGMEPFIEKMQNSIRSEKLTYIEASKNIEAINDADPHVWLNVENAKLELLEIKNKLSELNPKDAVIYKTNYEQHAKKLDELHVKYKESLENLDKKDIVVTHEAYGYLCDAYGLNQVAISGISAENEPTPARMAEIIKIVRDKHISYIFFEELASTKVAQAIANECGVKTLVLNPFEGFAENDVPKNYFDVMEENLNALTTALKN